MRTIEVDIIVVEGGHIEGQAPVSVLPGRYKVIVPVNDNETGALQHGEQLELPLHDIGRWPENLSLRREDMYDEWGR